VSTASPASTTDVKADAIKRALEGDSQAHMQLATWYREGTMMPKNWDKALYHYEKAGQGGINSAFLEAAALTLATQASVEDIDKAVKYIRLSMGTADPFSTSKTNRDATFGTDYTYVTTYNSEERLDDLIALAEAGDGSAAYRASIRYQDGLQIGKDQAKACYWLSQAILKGFVDVYEEVFGCIQEGLLPDFIFQEPEQLIAYVATINEYNVPSFIAEHYYAPLLFDQDFVKAQKYFELAALQNDDIALNYLGEMHRDGIIKPADQNKAHVYFERAAKLGLEIAMYNLGLSYLNQNDLHENERKAFEWFKRSAISRDFPPAMFEYARLNLFGIGTQQNVGVAKHYFVSARDAGMHEASCFVAVSDYLLAGKKDAAEQHLDTCE
jgi:TPR repeat protein